MAPRCYSGRLPIHIIRAEDGAEIRLGDAVSTNLVLKKADA